MSLSIEESIQKLKAEIIAQDWRLSAKRASRLDAAFSCLAKRFKSRKATSAMLVMAVSVLGYIKKFGGDPPETIDFLKEAMAHVVNLYEDLTYEPEKEEKIFQSLYSRFNALKDKIKKRQARPLPEEPPSVTSDVAQDNGASTDVEVVDTVAAVSALSPKDGGDNSSGQDVEQLISDLKKSLARADEVGTAIGKILEDLQEEKNMAGGASSSSSSAAGAIDSESEVKELQTVKTCPPTELCCVTVGGKSVAVPVGSIALIKPVAAGKLKAYLRNSNVPLKDFAGFLKKLAPQFAGNLSSIKDGKLKKMTLPLMLPQGFDLPEVPDDNAASLVVLSHGNWHGIIACNVKQEEAEIMVKFETRKNGDISGLGHLESGETVYLIDVLSVLRREGFLFMA